MKQHFSLLIQIASLFAGGAMAVEQQLQDQHNGRLQPESLHRNDGRLGAHTSQGYHTSRQEQAIPELASRPSSELILEKLMGMPSINRHAYVAEHGISVDHFFISIGAAATLFVRRQEHSGDGFVDGFFEAGVEIIDYSAFQQFSFHLEALDAEEVDCIDIPELGLNCRNLYSIEGIGGALLRADPHAGIDEEGISAYDPAIERPNPVNAAWALELRSSSQGDNDNDLVSIFNLATGRRLYAEENESGFELGGRSFFQFDVEEDQLFRHCINYSLEGSEYFSCQTGFVSN